MPIIYIDFATIYFYFRPNKNLIYEKQLLHQQNTLHSNISCWKMLMY